MPPPKNKRGVNRGAWAVQRERCRLPPEAEPPPGESASTFGEVLPAVMKQLGLDGPMWEQRLMAEWPELVGPQMARHTRPGRLERKILVIFVTSSMWLHELARFGQVQLLANIQRRFGADQIKSLRLQLDPDVRRR